MKEVRMNGLTEARYKLVSSLRANPQGLTRSELTRMNPKVHLLTIVHELGILKGFGSVVFDAQTTKWRYLR